MVNLKSLGTSLVIQWLRICLSTQGTWVGSLVWEDTTGQWATQPMPHSCWAHGLQSLQATATEACTPGPCALQREARVPRKSCARSLLLEKDWAQNQDPGQPKHKAKQKKLSLKKKEFAFLMAFVVWLFSRSVMPDSLWPHGLQHARLPCSLPSPGVCSNSCPLSQGCHPAISSSVISFSSCLQSSPPSGSFPVSWLFASGGHSIGASASTSVLPMNILGWFPLGLTGLILCPRDSQESSLAPQFESVNSSMLSLLYGPTLTSIHDYWKNHTFDYTDLCW